MTEPASATAVLVGTSLDPHVDAVADRLLPHFEVVRFDVDRYPRELQLSLETDGQSARGYLSTHPHLDILTVDLLWFRRLGQPGLPMNVDERMRKFCLAEANQTLEAMLLLARPGLVVNGLIETRRAAVKPLQYRIAAECGLAVPSTVVSNDSEVLSRVAQETASVSKTLSAPLLFDATTDGRAFSFTHLIDSDCLPTTQEVACAPVQLQQYVEPAFEVRVTSFKSNHIAVRLDSKEITANGVRDWRSSQTDISYESCTMPAETSTALGRLLDALGLQFAASDFIVDQDGRWHFLEANPHGAWLWLDEALGDDRITNMIASGMVRAAVSRRNSVNELT